MKQRSEDQVVISLLNAAKRREKRMGINYTHTVQVLAPIPMLQKVDMLLRKNSSVTRATIFRRALTMYLMAIERTKRNRPKAKPSK